MFIGWGTTTFRKIAWQNVELRAVALIGATSFTQSSDVGTRVVDPMISSFEAQITY